MRAVILLPVLLGVIALCAGSIIRDHDGEQLHYDHLRELGIHDYNYDHEEDHVHNHDHSYDSDNQHHNQRRQLDIHDDEYDHDRDHEHDHNNDHDHDHNNDHDHDHDHDQHHDHDQDQHHDHDHDHHHGHDHGHNGQHHNHRRELDIHDDEYDNDHDHDHDHDNDHDYELHDHDRDHDHDQDQYNDQAHDHDHDHDHGHNRDHHHHNHRRELDIDDDDHDHDDDHEHGHDNDHDHDRDHDHDQNHDHDYNHDHDNAYNGDRQHHNYRRDLDIHDDDHDHDDDNEHDHDNDHGRDQDHFDHSHECILDHEHEYDLEDHDHEEDDRNHDHGRGHDHDRDVDHDDDHHHDHEDVPTRAEKEDDLDWWETTIFYQIYPRSFADSDGDGIGDLNGITSKLEYIKSIGVGAIWMSPMFQSPMYDFGYDISDFYAVHDEYGTMEDFEALMKRAEELDIKVVLDLVPNHTSNESVWFQEALKGSDNKYYNYFVWEDGIVDENGNLQPPNNWLSHFRGSAWEYKEEVGKYYLHQFVIGQPDLNYRNPDVVEEMKNIIRFWLEKGVAGFRVDAVNCLFEVDKELFGGKYPDEPSSGRTDVDSGSHDSLSHIYTKDQNETYYMVYDWRDVLDEFKARDGVSRVMMTEVYAAIQDVVRYFGEGDRVGAQMPFNFDLITDVDASSSAADIKRAVDKFLTYKPVDKNSNWVVGNHDNPRMATRYGSNLVDGINMIVMLLPGVGVTYMGEELGMVDGYVSWEDTVDPSGCNTNDPINYWKSSRDPERTPFQWNAEKNAGFSTADKTWLPVAEGYEVLNVEAEQAAERSHLKIYQALADLRTDKIFRFGRYESLALNQDVFAFRRWRKNNSYLVIVNMRDAEIVVDLTYFENVTKDVQVQISSVASLKRKGDKFPANAFPVAPFEGVVLKVK